MAVSYRTSIRIDGSLFDGRAESEVDYILSELKKEVAGIGQDWIRIAAEGMDKSGRGGTGRASAGVQTEESGLTGDQIIYGEAIEGQVWWPWLEGVTHRNTTTRFKGYHTFRRTTFNLRRKAGDLVRARVEEFVQRMNHP